MAMESYVQVALRVSHNDGVFTYRLVGDEQKNLIGRRVRVTLRSRILIGVIIAHEPSPALSPAITIKPVIDVIDQEPIITQEQLSLMRFCAQYYFNPLGPCVHLAVPRDEGVPKPMAMEAGETPAVSLSDEQAVLAQRIWAHEAGAFLLEGVTGSGKTHIYIDIAKKTLALRRSVLFLVPEISLTPQLVDRVGSALGLSPMAMHSNITPAKKRDATAMLLNGHARVLIGARSAIFAPLRDLGLIVVDEEHDQSLKQDESPRYHARDLALWRGRAEGARVILGSATPSLESVYNARAKKLIHLRLEQRYNQKRSLPEIAIIDLKERGRDVDHRTRDKSTTAGQSMCILSRPLVEEMRKTLLDGAQVLLFLNQRGYARFGVCNDCGQLVRCPNCSVSLTFYQSRKLLLCHQCQHCQEQTSTCSSCHRDAVRFLGLGTERLEEEVKNLFPEHVVLRLDRDVVRSQRRLEDTLAAMHDRRADILIGTQMIAKGHDFLHVGLVGVVLADVAMAMPDFRAAERTFQVLTQVAGRAGRGHFSGRALIQTFDPSHPSIRCAKDHNVEEFLAQELVIRKRFFMPPFSRTALLRCEHKDKEIAEAIIGLAAHALKDDGRIMVMGPSPSPIERIDRRFRFQCMAVARSAAILHQSLARVASDERIKSRLDKSRARFAIDVDPQTMC